MKLLPEQSILKEPQVREEAGLPLDRQSGELLGYLDALFQRLVLPRHSAEEPALECSREEIRTLIILSSGGRMTMSDLAAALGVPLSTATHTIARLVDKGIVVRTRPEEDRRLVQVEMSEHGKGLQAAFRKRRQSVARSWLEPLSANERKVFLKLMAKITRLAALGPERRDS